ncbi:uncharacterized protein [Spinacia oleracea]|uniref:Uncharacterized protein isoform X1 n=1 Tax=Spinacia oleracea TaxID=3562 RepID=A0A9R0IUW1_SPIOL|nr:uncharacterized protein LOC110795256 isoform X1 [Spinacia oleracea]
MGSKKMIIMLVGILAIVSILQIRPSTAQEEEDVTVECWQRISNCITNSTSDSEFLECCSIIKQEIEEERECFCLPKDNILQDANTSATFTQIFSFCDISGSFQTLCPGPSPSPTGSLSPLSPVGSPALSPIGSLVPSPAGSVSDSTPVPSPTSSPLSPMEPLVFPSPPGTDDDSDSGSGSSTQSNSTNKVAFSAGLLTKALFLIILAIMVA